MSHTMTLAKPYAQAAFEFATEHKTIERWSAALEVAGCLVGDSTIMALYQSPKISREEFVDAVLALLKCEDDAHLRNFFKLLVQNKRFALLPYIAARFKDLENEATALVDVTLTTARPVDSVQQKQFVEKFEQKLGRKIELTCEQDPDLLGGMVVRYGDYVIDASLKTQIQKLAHSLTV